MSIETSVTILLFFGVFGVFLLWHYCDWKDAARLRSYRKRSAFLCRKCSHIYEAPSPRRNRREALCPHCGEGNVPLHF
ncbi:MAG: zinc ribbon domain-containing protein [Puniceicoccales bacterium]|nr:zinc ribbon domain-containing protein [Puniceicoccales bacterium]